MKKQEIFSKKNLVNVLLIAIFLIVLLVPQAKAVLIQGLMEIGLFKASDNKSELSDAAIPSNIMFKDINNQLVSLSDLKGKVVFINFWATWCPPCLAEMPSINKLHQTFKNDSQFVFITIDADGRFDKSIEYLRRKKYDLPLYVLASNFPEQLYNGSIPTTLVIDKKGRLVYHHTGAANYASSKFISFMEGQKKKLD